VEVSRQLHVPAALPYGKEVPISIDWPPEQIWTWWRRELFGKNS